MEVEAISSSASHQLISLVTRDWFVLINNVVLSSAIGVFGVAANVINMCVFLKQGLSSSVNTSFFAMAVSDLISLVFLLWLNVCVNPYMEAVDSPFIFIDIQYLTAGWIHGCFARITCGITAFVTTERCLSIILPLKIKTILTTGRSALILVLIYVLNILTLVPEYSTAYFAWNFYPSRNKTLLGLSFRSNRPETEGLIFTFHASFAAISFFLVSVFTVVLAVRLKESAKWRKTTAHAPSHKGETSAAREKRTVVLVILVATILIVCYTPTVVFSIVSSLTTEFSVLGSQSNLFSSAWSFAFLLHAVNSSVNIVTYYSMSSRYRETFWKLVAH